MTVKDQSVSISLPPLQEETVLGCGRSGDASPATPAGLMLLVSSPDVNLNPSCFIADAPL